MLKRSIAALGLAVLGGASLVGCSSTQDAAKIPHPIQTAWTAPATAPTATPTTHVGPTIPPTTAATARNTPQEDAQEAASQPEQGKVVESSTDDVPASQDGSHGSREDGKSSKKASTVPWGKPGKGSCTNAPNASQYYACMEMDRAFDNARDGLNEYADRVDRSIEDAQPDPVVKDLDMPEPTEDDELSELEKIDPPSQDNTPDM